MRAAHPIHQRIHPRTHQPAQARTHPVLLGECLGGALWTQDFAELCMEAGFVNPRRLSSNVIEVCGGVLCGWVGGWVRY